MTFITHTSTDVGVVIIYCTFKKQDSWSFDSTWSTHDYYAISCV